MILGKSKSPRLLIYEVIGIPFIAIVGSFLHFTYELSGSNFAVALVSAVNESVWEHLKLVFWPATFYMIIQLVLQKNIPKNFIIAKAVGIFTMPVVIVGGYYLYTMFLTESLIIDIGLFILSIIVGQLISYKLMHQTRSSYVLNVLAVIAIISLAIIFIVFTFYTPRIDIFRDPVTGGYGVS